MPHIPLREIAQRAGVSRMTVSRVIRNAPHVSPEIRSRVESALRKLDYSPNPLLGVLMQSLRSNRAGKPQAGIAYVADIAGAKGGLLRMHRRFRDGARLAAERLGYRIEVHECDGSVAALRLVQRVVTARGLLGVVFGPMSRIASPDLPIAFEQPHIVLGEQWPNSVSHRVENDQVHAAKLLFAELRRRGYARFGWLQPGAANPEDDYLYRVVLSHVQLGQRARDRVPVFGAQGFNEKSFREWFRRHEPDVLICKQQDHIAPWLEAMRLRAPEDVGLCCPDLEPGFMHIAGVAQLYERVTGAAVELVDGMIRRNERGIPGTPTYTLIEGRWNEGRTLRPAPRAA